VSGSLLLTFAERDGATRWQHALAGGVVVVGEKDGFTPQGSHGLIEKVDGATGAGLGFVPTSFLAGAVTPPTLAGGDVWFAFDVTVGGGLRAFGLQGVPTGARSSTPSAVSPSFASPAVAHPAVVGGGRRRRQDAGRRRPDGVRGVRRRCPLGRLGRPWVIGGSAEGLRAWDPPPRPPRRSSRTEWCTWARATAGSRPSPATAAAPSPA
jgi:hypothetical protein